MNSSVIHNLSNKSDDEINDFFKKFNQSNAKNTNFQAIDYDTRKALAKLIEERNENVELRITFLETIRVISRDKSNLDAILSPNICSMILMNAGLPVREGFQINYRVISEAQKCLINTLYNAQPMRDSFITSEQSSHTLLDYTSELDENIRKQSTIKWINDLSESEASEMWHLYLRIAFIVTATIKSVQNEWGNDETAIGKLLVSCERVLAPNKNIAEVDAKRADEALKVIFNIFCHKNEGCLNESDIDKTNRILREIIISKDPKIDEDLKQSAVNCFSLSPIKKNLDILCPTEGSEGKMDMTFTDELLQCLDKKLDKLPRDPNTTRSIEADLLGPYFQLLGQLCRDNKFVRRYCRNKVLPPLKDKEVEKRPEEEDSLRGRIVRLMMLPTCSKDIAAEFLFILCKRSVARMIKYTGFGHSAGMLANMGLLGQINEKKSASDSEDSETEEYNQVKDYVNPVTGSLFPPNEGSALANMSEEQKEYEAMKLVNAMNKMMEAGIVKPGTIGEDGKVKEVSHVLELTKNLKDEEVRDSDSD